MVTTKRQERNSAHDLLRLCVTGSIQTICLLPCICCSQGSRMQQRCRSLKGLVVNPSPRMRLICIHPLAHVIAFNVQTRRAHGVLWFHPNNRMHSFGTWIETPSCPIGWCREQDTSEKKSERGHQHNLHDSCFATSASANSRDAWQT